MPKIPKLSPTGISVETPKFTVDTSPNPALQVMGQIGGQIAKFGNDMLIKERKAEAVQYETDKNSEAIRVFQTGIIGYKNANPDGKGLSQYAENLKTELLKKAEDDAPSDDAFARANATINRNLSRYVLKEGTEELALGQKARFRNEDINVKTNLSFISNDASLENTVDLLNDTETKSNDLTDIYDRDASTKYYEKVKNDYSIAFIDKLVRKEGYSKAKAILADANSPVNANIKPSQRIDFLRKIDMYETRDLIKKGRNDMNSLQLASQAVLKAPTILSDRQIQEANNISSAILRNPEVQGIDKDRARVMNASIQISNEVMKDFEKDGIVGNTDPMIEAYFKANKGLVGEALKDSVRTQVNAQVKQLAVMKRKEPLNLVSKMDPKVNELFSRVGSENTPENVAANQDALNYLDIVYDKYNVEPAFRQHLTESKKAFIKDSISALQERNDSTGISQAVEHIANFYKGKVDTVMAEAGLDSYFLLNSVQNPKYRSELVTASDPEHKKTVEENLKIQKGWSSEKMKDNRDLITRKIWKSPIFQSYIASAATEDAANMERRTKIASEPLVTIVQQNIKNSNMNVDTAVADALKKIDAAQVIQKGRTNLHFNKETQIDNEAINVISDLRIPRNYTKIFDLPLEFNDRGIMKTIPEDDMNDNFRSNVTWVKIGNDRMRAVWRNGAPVKNKKNEIIEINASEIDTSSQLYKDFKEGVITNDILQDLIEIPVQ